MFEFISSNENDAIAIIKGDHDKVKDLFKQFENTDDLHSKKKIADEAIMELKIHAEIEEKIFYPFVRNGVDKDLMNEADEEHHVAKLLIAELDQMNASDDHWEAKFTVLAESIRHHIKEEEGDMLPQARRLGLDFGTLGRELLAMKHQLKKDGIPPCAEEKLMARNSRVNSPAKTTKKSSAKILSHTSQKKSATGKKAGKADAQHHTRKAS